MAKHKFHVIEQHLSAIDYTFEVYATSENEARHQVAIGKGKEIDKSYLYTVAGYPMKIVKVIHYIDTEPIDN